MPESVLQANSLAEAFLYLMVTPCPNCGRGSLKADNASPSGDSSTPSFTIRATCTGCAHDQSFIFSVPSSQVQGGSKTEDEMPARINLAERPSRIIDVAGWLTLFRVITEAAAKSQDKVEGRRLGYEAAQCLDEALRFYVEDNDLPPEGAFFSKSTQLRRQENPELFARSRLINMRARLPSIDAMERRLAGGTATKKKWWKPWA